MIIQCPSCRALVSIDHALSLEDRQQVGLRCPECGVVNALQLHGTPVQDQKSFPSSAHPAPEDHAAVATPMAPLLERAFSDPLAPSSGDGNPPRSEWTNVVMPAAGGPSMIPPAESIVTPPSEVPFSGDPLPPSSGAEKNALTGSGSAADPIRDAIASVGPVDDASRPVVDALLALVPSWDDLDAHKKLVRRAALEEQLAPLGVRYRAVMQVRPDDATSKAAQEEILAQALVRMKSAPGGSNQDLERGKMVTKVAMAVVALLMGGAIWFMVASMRSF